VLFMLLSLLAGIGKDTVVPMVIGFLFGWPITAQLFVIPEVRVSDQVIEFFQR
jgi:hypothetical protein